MKEASFTDVQPVGGLLSQSPDVTGLSQLLFQTFLEAKKRMHEGNRLQTLGQKVKTIARGIKNQLTHQ